MMLIATSLGPSPIHGIGVFAVDFIPSGTPVWEFTPGFDLLVPVDGIGRLNSIARDYFLKIAYISQISGHYVFCCDGAGFMNHSESPNIGCGSFPDRVPGKRVDQEKPCFALRDILAGEELTVDYREFDAAPIDVYPELRRAF